MATTVIGAGYAGVMAANRLAASGESVTLVTPHPWFVERIRLHALASGARHTARVDLRELLHPEVDLVLGTVHRIEDGRLALGSGGEIGYETLLYAVGSGADAPGSDGVHTVSSEAGAMALREALIAWPEAPVTVVGAGLTGVELAGVLREAGRSVRLLTDRSPARRAAREHLSALERAGVETQVQHWAWDETDGRTEGNRPIVVAATGFRVPSLATASGLPTDPHGRLLVDEHLEVPGRPGILGAGDAVQIAAPGYRHLRPACATALPMGAHAADVILDRARGRTPRAFQLGYVLQCVDLGGGRGHVQAVHPDDRERPYAIRGRAGGLLKEAVCRMTLRWLAREAHRPGSYRWVAGPAQAEDAA